MAATEAPVEMLRLEGVVKRYGGFTAVAGLDRGWVNRCVNGSGCDLPLIG